MNQQNEVPRIQQDQIEMINDQVPASSAIPRDIVDGPADLHFGAIVKELRRRKRMTQKQLAHQMGHLTAEWLAMIETGQRPIKLEEVSPLAQLLHTDPKTLAVVALRNYAPNLASVLFPDSTNEQMLPGAEDVDGQEKLLPATLAVAKGFEQLDPRQRKLIEELVRELGERADSRKPGPRGVPRRNKPGNDFIIVGAPSPSPL
jgi:transcriptional regulator with XRE-family HTH domain